MYWDDHEKSKRTFAGDLIRTGDLVTRDADGYFHYRGRVDELLKVGGIWVAPLEIEDCLLGHRAVVECAVVGYEEDGLVRPCAYIVAGEGIEPSERLADELRQYVRSQLSPHKYPRDIRFVSELPETASGKLDRRSLRAELSQARQSRRPAPDLERQRLRWHTWSGSTLAGPAPTASWSTTTAVTLGKAFSTPPDFSGGILEAIAVAADELGVERGGARRYSPPPTQHDRRRERGRGRDARKSRGDHDTWLRPHAVRDARRIWTMVRAHRRRKAKPDRDRQADANRAVATDQDSTGAGGRPRPRAVRRGRWRA